ncbi:hypothetical protein [Mitsuaria sp. 7]|uniref:hypothetical protein n=1 Tax=Mitsuaria sp. 7 TaxID=1658665 RepID=UPI0007DD25B7|nr:hypothetical protein [Mitsuaria sp. 7]ANH68248.1 hypothetical protein ABE85_12985 [Mitsuaria sp. 7]
MTPSNLSANIASRVPHFRTLAETEQWAITRMAWAWASGPSHDVYAGYCAFPKQRLRTLWKSDQRARDRLQYHYFHVLPGIRGQRVAHAWRPKAELLEAIQASCDDPQPCDLLDDKGRPIRRLQTALPARRGPSKSSYVGLACTNAVEINVAALQYCSAVAPREQDRKFAKALLRLANNKLAPGRVPIRYEEKDTGRLFARGGVLQGYSREARKAALSGAWDYDISNCHFAVLRHFAIRLGIETPTVAAYLVSKRETRERLSRTCNADVDAVKQALIALVYGMSLSPRLHGSLARTLGSQDAAKRFGQDKFVRSLLTEIKTLIAPLIELHAKPFGRVVNAIGRAAPMSRGKWRLLAHLLQGVEASALRAVLDAHGGDVLLAVHDGWIFKRHVEPAAVEALIERATGVRLSLECQPLQTPVNDQTISSISHSNQQVTEHSLQICASTEGSLQTQGQDPLQAQPLPQPPLVPDIFYNTDPVKDRPRGLVLSGCVSWSVPTHVTGVEWSSGRRRRTAAPAVEAVAMNQTD